VNKKVKNDFFDTLKHGAEHRAFGFIIHFLHQPNQLKKPPVGLGLGLGRGWDTS